MASSKLKVKSLDRTTLYYGKFEYRVVLESPHMFYSWSCKTIDDYRIRITDACADYDKYSDHYGAASRLQPWRRPKPNVEDWEYKLIENILNLEKKYKLKKDLTFRREGKRCNVYTSNPKIVKEILAFKPDAEVTQVQLMPTGIKYFKRTPPSTYRAYMTNNKMPTEFKDDMLQYLERTPDVRPSDAFYTYLQRANKYNYALYLWDNYFVDYDDDKNLMMMTLMFPGMIGKKFKLERK